MAMYKNNKYNTTAVNELDSGERASEILELEDAREEINMEIESLLVSYKKLTGKRKAVKGAKKIGRTVKDYSYWHKYED